MSGEYFDQDEVIAFGQPWHGALHNSTLVTSSGVEMAITVPATSPDTHLVEFPGMPVPANPTDDLVAGRELRNYAILFGNGRRYSPKADVSFGPSRHVYLTEDSSHYHIQIVASNISGAVADGASWGLAFRVDARKASGGALGAASVIVAQQDLPITGFGGSGYYAQTSNFSPDGKKVAICIHKFASAAHASSLDARRSLGVAGVWEVVLSGGSKDAPPAAALSLIKGTAACQYESNASPVEYVADIGYAVTDSGEGAATPVPSPPGPAGLVTLDVWQDWTINLDKASYYPSAIEYHAIGAAYNVSNNLCVIAYEIEATITVTDEYSGPSDGEIIHLTANVEAFASDHSIVTNVIGQGGGVEVRIYVTATATTRWRLKAGATTLCEAIGTTDWTGIDGAGSGKSGWLELFLVHSPPLSVWQTFGGAAVRTFASESVASWPIVTARMTSNNTATMFRDAAAHAIVSPSGIIGGPQTLTLDSNGLPWCAWNPKTADLATTPGYSWC